MTRYLHTLVSAAICCMAFMPASFALQPDLEISQFQHTGWTIGDGAPPDIWALAQSPDGFLWMATGAGLYRFDGITFERFRPTNNEEFESVNMAAVTVSQSGTLWIGYDSAGVSEISGGRLTNFSEKDGIPIGRVYSIAIDHAGATWAASQHGLFRFYRGRWQHIEKTWNYPFERADFLHVARDGTLWVTASGLAFLKPGTCKFEILDTPITRFAVPAEDRSGNIWIADSLYGIFRIDKTPPLGVLQNDARLGTVVHAKSIMFDRDGVMWGTDADRGGLFRVRSPASAHQPLLRSDVYDTFGERDGLTASIAVPLLEDTEGDIWVGTNLGLNRFRENSFMRVPGLSSQSPTGFSMIKDTNGDVLVTDAPALYLVRRGAPAQLVATTTLSYMNVFVDRRGSTWLSGLDRTASKSLIGKLDGARLRPVDPQPEIHNYPSQILGEDGNGELITGIDGTRMVILRDRKWLRFNPNNALSDRPFSFFLEDTHGRIWVAYHGSALVVIDGKSTRFLTAKDGLTIGDVSAIADIDGKIFLGCEQGLAVYDGRVIKSIDANRLPAFSGITGIVRSPDGAIWTNGILGIVRIAQTELDKAFHDPDYHFRFRHFDYRDGVSGMAQQSVRRQTALVDKRGYLWFVTNHGIITINPGRLTENTHVPPVSILSLTVDGRSLQARDQIVPAGAKEVRIDYTALSLQVPERVRFRYMLEGFATTWTDPGRLRQAFFTNLPPGRYRFRVIASNNDGIWNSKGASVAFVIPPTFLQSWAFTLLCAVAGIAVLWSLYSLRLKQVAAGVQSRLEERIRERERIARELHDTLLQSVQGLILRICAASRKMQADDPRRYELDAAITRADQILLDGRERVRLLRSVDNRSDLPTALTRLGEELAAESPARFRVIVEGEVRELHAIVCEELMWIGREALINAFTHARAHHIDVEIAYHWRELGLQIRDDGEGLPDDVATSGEREGHFGLIGIRERARRIGAKFEIQSKRGAGTEMTVFVPAAVAYTDARWFRDLWVFRRPVSRDIQR